MPTIHCHRCGGFISNPEGTTYRDLPADVASVVPHSGLCLCDHPVVYEQSSPAPTEAAAVHRIRSASRN